jgi:hypothetical protein
MQGGAAQRSGGEKQMSRAEEVDIANRVIDENLKKSRARDDARPPENALDDEDVNFLKETRRQQEEEDKFNAFEEEQGFEFAGGDDANSDDEIFDVSELADPEMGSVLADRDRAREPPQSPPEPKPEPAPQSDSDVGFREVVVASDVVNPFLGSTSAEGPSLADQLAETRSPPFSETGNKLDTIDALERRVKDRQQKLQTLSRTG